MKVGPTKTNGRKTEEKAELRFHRQRIPRKRISRIEPLNRSSRREEALAISDFRFQTEPSYVGCYEVHGTREPIKSSSALPPPVSTARSCRSRSIAQILP